MIVAVVRLAVVMIVGVVSVRVVIEQLGDERIVVGVDVRPLAARVLVIEERRARHRHREREKRGDQRRQIRELCANALHCRMAANHSRAYRRTS